ncbi:MAG TPA: phosphatidate cytidylyltransferase [Patescibacteria group bacterium]|nr:phosphatidate cytidylyltransferase [Patescibacteria group bacterium]
MQKRILTAVVGIPFAIFVINYGQWLYDIVIGLLALLAWLEFQGMMQQGKSIPVWPGLGFGGTALLLVMAAIGWFNLFVFGILMIVFMALTKPLFYQEEFAMEAAAWTVLGVLYVGLSFSHLLLLRFSADAMLPVGMTQGTVYLWMAFLGTWASDTFAYLIGSKWGKHKLCPRISPGKTVEGALGGLAGSLAVVAGFGFYLMIPLIHALSIGLLVGIAAPIGDLVESALKRFAGVKDSGSVLPGHGGILDRFDGIMFAAPAVYYYALIFVFS